MKVMIVDDRREIRLLASQLILSIGGETVLASSGQEAIALLRDEHAASRRIDLMLMDIQMPDMDGITAIQHIRSMGCSMPVVAMSGASGLSVREVCLEAGFTAFLDKPIRIENLKSLVCALCACI